jgi:hypothetical protein
MEACLVELLEAQALAQVYHKELIFARVGEYPIAS